MHEKTPKQALEELKSSEKGISQEEAEKRLKEHGPNRLEELHRINPLKMFLSQFKGVLVLILIFAAVVSALLGETLDTIIICVILVLNAALGFIQEYKAEKAIEALKKLTSPKASVIRDGKRTEIDSEELVPGDMVLLETGMIVPADCRLIEQVNLHIQESVLTGESVPVAKKTEEIEEKAQLADRVNLAYSGTTITRGRSKALVFATGMGTEIGKIAGIIEETPEEKTPLQKNLATLGKRIGEVVVGIALIIFLGGVLRAEGTMIEMFIVAVALAVAAVPEGLPAVVTVSLAIGVQKMAKKSALVRRLPSIETLGCTTVICTDKTGTLTCNQMTVKKIYVDGKTLELTGNGLKAGEIKGKTKDLKLMLRIGILCNDAELDKGDPTEIALLVSGSKGGLDKAKLEKIEPRVSEIEFDSKRKLMSTIHQTGWKQIVYSKGAPDVLLGRCGRIIDNGRIRKLTQKDREAILEKNKEFASNALRVLGFAYKEHPGKRKIEENLIFAGLQGMIDPPRKGVKEAVARCTTAGIMTVMVTGDHKETAVAVGKAIGIEGKAVTGAEIDEIDIGSEKIAIFSRVDPEHKVRIVEALKKKGHIVAMTGDGINDAPALKKADIGIAMGRSGTDVAREASDIVLVDDHFASIVNAVEEGRGVYANIGKFVYYLLSSNVGEVMTIFLGIMLGLPLPLLAIHILWMNLVTDGLPALALGVEPKEKDLMSREPRKQAKGIIGKRRAYLMLLRGTVIAAGTLLIFMRYLPDVGYARTMALTSLILFQMFNALNAKTEKASSLSILFTNKYLIGAIGLSIMMQILLIYTPLSGLFELTRLPLFDWGLATLVASTGFWLAEITKLLERRKRL